MVASHEVEGQLRSIRDS